MKQTKRTRRMAVTFACVSLLLATLLCGCGNGGTGDSAKGYVFTLKGLDLYVGQAIDVMDAYGTPIAYDESEACGGIPGKDYVYQYAGVTIKTTPAEGNKNVICMIELTDDTYKTPEGLTIGSSADTVKKAMGTADSATDT